MSPAQLEQAARCATCAAPLRPTHTYCGQCGHAQRGAIEDNPITDHRVLLPTRPGSTRGIALTGMSIGLVIVLAITILVVRAAFFTPADLVRSYFDALVDRDADRAWSMLAHDEVGPRHSLLATTTIDDAGYEPPANVSVEQVTRDGEEAVANVAFDVAGVPQRLSLTLERGRRGLLQRWHIVGGLFALYVAGDPGGELRFAGALAAREQSGEVFGFPGGYAVGLAAHPLLELEPATAIAGGEPAAVSFTVHDEGVRVIAERVHAYLDDCLASGELAPDGCPFGASEYSFLEEYTGISWSLIDYPQLSYDVGDDGSVYVSGSDGLANVTASATSGFSPDLDEDVELSVGGWMMVEDDQVWFEPDGF